MSLQWGLIAGFLYTEIATVLLLISPLLSPIQWQKFFRSRFLTIIRERASIYFLFLIGILILFLLDAIREMRKYSTVEHTDHSMHLDAEMQGNMRLFRAQRNFYISGFTLFLSLVIRRLVMLISTQATLIAQNEASMRQAQSATTTAKSLLSQKAGENAQNDSNESSEWKNQIKELQVKNQELEQQLSKEKKDRDAVKSQAEALAKEYDRLSDEHSKCLQSAGDKKSD
ncbi:B-cell receptor-associated protein 31 [Ceratina calcarata]|uniref:Endoplasmic reticulum transmembrane protein n=1 Tax=Ceratina calcarata TaxID=156304 RepID=A0AAJ7JFZ2_9HYME|nr:B-cell receptor-associated protein 31 [Ceratina calcarata]XP_017891847.1 B-cell receptor-associated protein 31 [Ceratina calcarata]XP_026675168.1 B-cell receptor-associated protein 31 [Ceratina calcarata]